MRRLTITAVLLLLVTATVSAACGPFCLGPLCRHRPVQTPQVPRQPAIDTSKLNVTETQLLKSQLAQMQSQLSTLTLEVHRLQKQQITVTVTDRGQQVARHENVAHGSTLAVSFVPEIGE